jgi:hypothetical protein
MKCFVLIRDPDKVLSSMYSFGGVVFFLFVLICLKYMGHINISILGLGSKQLLPIKNQLLQIKFKK